MQRKSYIFMRQKEAAPNYEYSGDSLSIIKIIGARRLCIMHKEDILSRISIRKSSPPTTTSSFHGDVEIRLLPEPETNFIPYQVFAHEYRKRK